MFRTHCPDDHLLAHLDGELTRRAMRRVGRHLQQCWDCRARQAELEATVRIVSTATSAAAANLPAERLAQARRRFAARRDQFERERTNAAQFILRHQLTSRWRPALMALTVLATVALIVIVQLTQPVSAAGLITRSMAADHALLADPAIAVHGVWQVESRRLPQGAVIDRRRIELWSRGGQSASVRRAFDARNQLIAGEWRHADGRRTLYVPGAPATSAGPAAIAVNEAWRLDPTANGFAALVPDSATARLAVTGDAAEATYLITYVRNANANANASGSGSETADEGLVRATLRIRRADLHAIEQTLVISEHGQLTELRFAETAWDRQAAALVAAAVFEPDAALLAATPIAAATPLATPTPAPAPTRAVVATPSTAALDRLEFDAWYQLHRLERCVAGTPDITRVRSRISVTAHLADVACRQPVADAMAALAPAEALRVDMIPPAAPAAPSAPTTMSAGRDTTSAEAVFADWTLARSAEAREHAMALKRLIDRWPPAAIRAFDLDASANWQNMVRREARRVAEDVRILRTHLQPIYFAQLPLPDSSPVPAPRTADAVPIAVDRLLASVAASDDTVRRLFAPTAAGVAQDVSSRNRFDALGRALREAELIAAGFDEPWPLPQPEH